MKITILSIALSSVIYALTGCASNPESAALGREAFAVALAEYQRQNPVVNPAK